MEVPTLVPHKALKVNPSSTAHWVAEAQATLQPDAASARADQKELATQGGAAEVAPTQMGEGALPPHEGEAHEPDEGKVPSVAEATEVEAPRVSEAKAMEAGAPRTAEATAAGAGAPATTEAMMMEAGALGTTKADVITSRDDPKGEPLFTLEDAAEGGRWDTFEQYRQLAEQSLQTALSVVADDLLGVAQDQLQRQKGLLAGANELLAVRSVEVEDLRLHCANAKVEVAMAQDQVAPLAARVKELEEELTCVAELGREASRVAEASRVEAQRLKEKAEASQVEAQRGKEKAEASQVEA
ncbi:uncharacterized protein [Miscanthus floridulus]|uniref:uncharacterized protein n=1 Tax=Miscanthus floridulus TaxID=154761 RepID=UPI003459250C